MEENMIRRTFILALAAAGLAAGALPAQADNYPSRTVTIIVPYPAGGPTDQAARVVADSLSKQLKQSFIVENVTGGGTIIATNKVAKAPPDGYMLLLHNLQISANVTLYKNLPFDTEKDLTPIIFVNRNPLVLVGRKDLDANDLNQLLALMKKKTLNAAIPGFGATGHLATALLAQEAGVKINMIPYRGAAPALNDIIGSHVDLFFATPQSIIQQVNTHNMKAFAVTSKAKLPELPKLGSFVDAFGPKLDISYWQALFAPSGTPKDVIAKLNAAMQKTVSDPAIVKSWASQSVEVYPPDERSTAAADKMFKSEIARWGKVIKDNNIHLDQ
jgi:tripartite-type tricarboxylate transporter receptor subunit TctC